VKSVAQVLKEIDEVADQHDLPSPYLVGGAVRDLLLDKSPSDYDITCGEIDALGLADNFAREKHIPLRVYRSGAKKLRYSGLDLDFSPHTIYTKGNSPFLDELFSRDYTINAMLIACSNGKFLDPCGGYEDLQKGILRCAFDPETTFKNPANAIRGVKLIANGWTPTEDTEEGIVENLHKVSELHGYQGEKIINAAIRADPEIVVWLADRGLLSVVPQTKLLVEELRRRRMLHHV
jgi:hypothetical protein